MLLLPNGKQYEAVGTFSGVQPRSAWLGDLAYSLVKGYGVYYNTRRGVWIRTLYCPKGHSVMGAWETLGISNIRYDWLEFFSRGPYVHPYYNEPHPNYLYWLHFKNYSTYSNVYTYQFMTCARR